MQFSPNTCMIRNNRCLNPDEQRTYLLRANTSIGLPVTFPVLVAEVREDKTNCRSLERFSPHISCVDRGRIQVIQVPTLDLSCRLPLFQQLCTFGGFLPHAPHWWVAFNAVRLSLQQRAVRLQLEPIDIADLSCEIISCISKAVVPWEESVTTALRENEPLTTREVNEFCGSSQRICTVNADTWPTRGELKVCVFDFFRSWAGIAFLWCTLNYPFANKNTSNVVMTDSLDTFQSEMSQAWEENLSPSAVLYWVGLTKTQSSWMNNRCSDVGSSCVPSRTVQASKGATSVHCPDAGLQTAYACTCMTGMSTPNCTDHLQKDAKVWFGMHCTMPRVPLSVWNLWRTPTRFLSETSGEQRSACCFLQNLQMQFGTNWIYSPWSQFNLHPLMLLALSNDAVIIKVVLLGPSLQTWYHGCVKVSVHRDRGMWNVHRFIIFDSLAHESSHISCCVFGSFGTVHLQIMSIYLFNLSACVDLLEYPKLSQGLLVPVMRTDWLKICKDCFIKNTEAAKKFLWWPLEMVLGEKHVDWGTNPTFSHICGRTSLPIWSRIGPVLVRSLQFCFGGKRICFLRDGGRALTSVSNFIFPAKTVLCLHAAHN